MTHLSVISAERSTFSILKARVLQFTGCRCDPDMRSARETQTASPTLQRPRLRYARPRSDLAADAGKERWRRSKP